MKIWFIYAYKRTDTGQYVYVGSTLDPHKRHRRRLVRHSTSKSRSCPWDRELAANPNAYSYEIVEAFWGDIKQALPREDHWMKVCQTFRTKGCFNFARAVDAWWSGTPDYGAWLAARQAAQTTPDVLARKSAAQKKVGATAAFKANMSAAMKKVMARPEVKNKVRATVAAKRSYYGA